MDLAHTSAGNVRRVTGAESENGGRRPVRGLRAGSAVVLVAHGLLHLLGVALLWRWGEPRYDDVHPAAGSSPALVVGASG
ncbi:hypothetical protein SAMN05660657_05381 [Geodermatophilus amargosae]|uniref:Uncharacterized protein n=1 Tax=Geodermatophilus amargosae TaxID=1296565 RepID=A0A1I7D6L0_9ACTN|nr:hypothetical protein SAMN05660657_05381 [Geodermatophilus amargosae]